MYKDNLVIDDDCREILKGVKNKSKYVREAIKFYHNSQVMNGPAPIPRAEVVAVKW